MNEKQNTADDLSPLHDMLNTTPSMVHAELLAADIDPEEAVAAMRRLAVTMESKYATQLAREKSTHRYLAKSLPPCEETAAVGVPA